MLPNKYSCNSCGEIFEFSFRKALYHLGSAALDAPINGHDLLLVPVRPAWCKECGSVCLVEDIAPVRTFEAAYATVRAGKPIDYPIESAHWDPEDVEPVVAAYLSWRLQRGRPARALCCGRTSYQFLDVPQPLLKHAECDFGFIEAMYSIGGGVYRTPGLYSPDHTRVYSPEGELLGRRTWWNRDEETWQVEAMSYPPVAED
jgi:hypothetical protein